MNNALTNACEQSVYNVTESDLPVSCPLPSMSLWNAHPKVYLAFKEGKAQCAYCSAVYILDGKATH